MTMFEIGLLAFLGIVLVGGMVGFLVFNFKDEDTK